MRITESRLRSAIREAVMEKFKDPDEIDFDKIRGMKPSEINSLPKDQRPLANIVMSKRDTAGRRVASARADLASNKIFELMDILRESDSFEEFNKASRQLMGSLEFYEYKACAKVLSEIRERLLWLGKRFGAIHASDQGLKYFLPLPDPMKYAVTFWPDFSAIVFSEVMTGEAIREFETNTGKKLSQDMDILKMNDDDIRLTAQRLIRDVESQRRAESERG